VDPGSRERDQLWSIECPRRAYPLKTNLNSCQIWAATDLKWGMQMVNARLLSSHFIGFPVFQPRSPVRHMLKNEYKPRKFIFPLVSLFPPSPIITPLLLTISPSYSYCNRYSPPAFTLPKYLPSACFLSLPRIHLP
jgi:hypothetical protein